MFPSSSSSSFYSKWKKSLKANTLALDGVNFFYQFRFPSNYVDIIYILFQFLFFVISNSSRNCSIPIPLDANLNWNNTLQKFQMLAPEKCVSILYLYYKRGDLYLCSAKAPLLPGSGSRRVDRRKGTSLDRVYVCL